MIIFLQYPLAEGSQWKQAVPFLTMVSNWSMFDVRCGSMFGKNIDEGSTLHTPHNLNKFKTKTNQQAQRQHNVHHANPQEPLP